MVKIPQRQTVYADYLYQKVDELLQKGRGFTLPELANFSGLKITGNMRRRIQHSVVTGKLKVEPVLQGNKGSINHYDYPPIETEGFEETW